MKFLKVILAAASISSCGSHHKSAPAPADPISPTSSAPAPSASLAPAAAPSTPASGGTSQPLTPSPTTSAIPVDLGFMVCHNIDPAGSYIGGCVFKSDTLAPVQSVLSTFAVTYTFDCPGSSLDLALATDKQTGVMLTNQQTAISQTATLYGYGPLTVVSTNPTALDGAILMSGCAMNVQSIAIAPAS